MTNNEINSTTPPHKCGKYWARAKGYKWWCFITEISGEAPFLKVQILHTLTSSAHDVTDIVQYGGEVTYPSQPTITQRG